MKARTILVVTQVIVTFLFIHHVQRVEFAAAGMLWSMFPFLPLALIIVNSFWCSRFTSWAIFSAAFFGFLITLSAFTLRWRLEPGFVAAPFYRSIAMYVLMVYIGLAQMKLHFKERGT